MAFTPGVPTCLVLIIFVPKGGIRNRDLITPAGYAPGIAPAGTMIARWALAGPARVCSPALVGRIRARLHFWGLPGMLCPYSEHAPIRFRAWWTAPQKIFKLRRSGVPKFLICALLLLLL